jgi:hypothetical protein
LSEIVKRSLVSLRACDAGRAIDAPPFRELLRLAPIDVDVDDVDEDDEDDVVPAGLLSDTLNTVAA